MDAPTFSSGSSRLDDNTGPQIEESAYAPARDPGIARSNGWVLRAASYDRSFPFKYQLACFDVTAASVGLKQRAGTAHATEK